MAGNTNAEKIAPAISFLATYSLHHRPVPFGNYLPPNEGQIGSRAASAATAHKMAVIMYTWLKIGLKLNMINPSGPPGTL